MNPTPEAPSGTRLDTPAAGAPEGAAAGRARIVAHGLSDIGMVRDENQDAFLIREPEDARQRAEKGVLVVVADGMGGLEGGGLASRLTVEAVERAYYRDQAAAPLALENAVKQANREVHEIAGDLPNGRQMGSTLTAASLVGRRAWIAQVGDSRAYFYRGGKIRQVTKDHSLLRELAERGNIDMTAGKWLFNRNIITRGLGLEPEVAVDLYDIPELEAGDAFLLSSDGFHELVTEEEMAAGLERFVGDLDGACRDYIRMARERGGPDNITVALARVEEVEESPADSAREGGAPARAAREGSGWFLPLALFLSFAAGVVSTLLLETRSPVGEREVRELRAQIEAALRSTGAEAREARARLERALEILSAAGGAASKGE